MTIELSALSCQPSAFLRLTMFQLNAKSPRGTSNVSGPPQTHNELLIIKPGHVELSVSVVPRSSRLEIAGIHNNTLRIKLTSPPVDNEANTQCCAFLAKLLGIAKGQVSIVHGKTSRRKVVKIERVSVELIRDKLLQENK
jgi:uncharacterized protein